MRRMPSPSSMPLCWSLLAALCVVAVPAAAQPEAPTETPEPTGPQPFGANLFEGNYATQRDSGINDDYRLLPGDQVAVNVWGTVTINEVFPLDAQGNIFLPQVGPVHLGGVPNSRLSSVVEASLRRVYRGAIGVYTNLLTASPVAVFVTGGVARPGRYAGLPSDSVLFFLAQAGGIDPEQGSYRRIRVLRQGNEVAALDLYAFLLEGNLAPVQLEAGDTILVERRGPAVLVEGIEHPVIVELSGPQSTGSEVLEVIGPQPRANELTHSGTRDGEPFVASLAATELAATALADGDELVLRQEGRTEQITIRLEGEFEGPAVLTVRRGSRLQDVLNHVPVDPTLALPEAVHLRRRSVASEQRRMIQDSLDRLERSAVLGLSGSAGEAQIRVQEAELVRSFVQRARNARPQGRVVTSSAGRQVNILLEDGDTVVIPTRTNVVQIGGEVRSVQAAMYRPDLEVRDYVQMAGGYSNRAETDAVIVLRPNGEVLIGPSDMPIGAGDRIIVPPRIDRKVFQYAMDITRILYEIAVATSVVVRAF